MTEPDPGNPPNEEWEDTQYEERREVAFSHGNDPDGDSTKREGYFAPQQDLSDTPEPQRYTDNF